MIAVVTIYALLHYKSSCGIDEVPIWDIERESGHPSQIEESG